MENTILVTVGTSAITNWLKNGNDTSVTHAANYEDSIANKPITETLSREYLQLFEAIKNEIMCQIEPNRQIGTSGRLLPAEVMTLTGMQRDQDVNLSKEADTIVLFYSDTLDGKMAGDINAAILAKLGYATVTLEKMTEVSAGVDGFKKLTEEYYFKNLFMNHLPDNEENSLRVIFSGGYKAFIPPLRDYCRDARPPIPMYYLYEESDQIIKYGANGCADTSARLHPMDCF